jgi:hypothetical protein
VACIATAFVVVGPTSEAATYTVGHSGSFDFQTLSASAVSASIGDTLIIAPDVYDATQGELFPISIKSLMTLQRQGSQGTVTVQGNGGSSVFRMENVLGVTLTGLTISGGSADQGGGLQALSSLADISDCVFENNRARQGGGAYLWNSDIHFTGCRFSGNSAAAPAFGDGGGGVYCLGGYPTFEDCAFAGNTVSGGDSSGGGLYCASQAMVDQCRFCKNKGAAYGGGAWIAGSSQLMSCVFTENEAGFWGGGAYVYFSKPAIEGCDFVQNKASGEGDGGGGLAADGDGPIQVSSCRFLGNFSIRGGGVVSWRNAGPLFKNCLWAGNSAWSGGAVVTASDGAAEVTFSTFIGNTSASRGSGVLCQENSQATVTGSLFLNNRQIDVAELGMNADAVCEYNLFYGNANGVFFDEGETPFTDVSSAQGAVDGFVHNIGEDPLLVTAATGTWTQNAVYLSQDCQSQVFDSGAHWGANEFAGRDFVLNPNTLFSTYLPIVSNTSQTLTLAGNAAGLAPAGASYFVLRIAPGPGSPALDNGPLAGPAEDILGWMRPEDIPGMGRDQSGDEFDIGAVEVPPSQLVPTPTPTQTSIPAETPTPRPTWSNPRSDVNLDGQVDEWDLFEFLLNYQAE